MGEARKLAHMLRALNEAQSTAHRCDTWWCIQVGLAWPAFATLPLQRTKQFGLTETRLGLIPTISPYVIARMGEGKARRIFMSARFFSAAEAKALDLIADHVPKEGLEARVEAEIIPYLSVSPKAVAASKALARMLGQSINDQVIDQTIMRLCDTWEGEEAQEGIDAFLSKRKPRWA